MRTGAGSVGAVGVLVGALLLGACGTEAATSAADRRPTIGILRLVPSELYDVFFEELTAQGWEPGRKVRVLPEEQEEVFATPEEAEDALRSWVAGGLDVVIAFSTPYSQLVMDETDLPGLFVVNDPVESGLTSDLSRPDGQLSGVRWHVPADRTLDVASRVLGGMASVGYLQPSDDPAVAGHREGVLEAAERLGIEVVEVSFASPGDVPEAVDRLAAAGVEAVYLTSSNATAAALAELEAELERHRLPAIANVSFVEFATVTLQPDVAELHRQLARQVARLLSGSAVESIPVEEPRRFVLTIDRTRAEALLGRDVDPQVLRQADVVR